jgi:hypothetical protein
MKRATLFAFALFFAGLLCVVQQPRAQVAATGAGKLPGVPITVPSGLQSYYSLDNIIGGTLSDTNPNGYGPINLTTNTATSIAGQIANAVTFNGTTQYAAAVATAPVVVYPLTMCFWAKTGTAGVPLGLLSPAIGNWDGWYFGVSATNYSFTAVSNNTFSTGASTAALTIANWNFVCGVATSATSRTVYGNAVAGTADTSNITPTRSDLAIGLAASVQTSVNNFYAGTIDDVRLYNRALSGSDITSIYNAGVAGHP